jgi:hypothetical protein
LNKTHSICKSLPGCAYKSDGTRLRSHDAQQYKIPRHIPVAQEIAIQVFRGLAFINTIHYDAGEGYNKHYPILVTHSNLLKIDFYKKKNSFLIPVNEPTCPVGRQKKKIFILQRMKQVMKINLVMKKSIQNN